MNTILLIAALLTAGSLMAKESCRPDEQGIVDADVRCVEKGGISISFVGEGGVKGACMASPAVQSACGVDGQGTRRMAFAQWMERLKAFERRCAEQEGTFSFKDPTFTEPANEAYCLQAQPEIGSSMFEEPLCNYRSLCPTVTVTCSFNCGREDLF